MSVSSVFFRALAGEPLREFYTFAPPSAQPGAPLVVLVHGISRRAAEQVASFAQEAERLGVVLVAPIFGRRKFGQYQQVIDRRGTRCDQALLEMVKSVALQTGCDGNRFHIFGYSGGAQFAHRFALLHPLRILSMSVAAAGWYTMPDQKLRYPYGIGTHPVPGEKFTPEHFLCIDRHVFVGSADNSYDAALRSSDKLNERQGTTRLERAVRWAAEMDEASEAFSVKPANSTFEILKGVGHSFSAAVRRRKLPARVLSKLF